MKLPLRVGIDVGGTNLRVGVLSSTDLIWESRRQTNFSEICQRNVPSEALRCILSTLVDTISEACNRYPQVQSVGIGFPGFIDPVSHVISTSPNLPGLVNVDLVTPLMKRFSLPVWLHNDALTAAYGEYLLTKPDSGSLLYVGLGTGVGGGLILHGQPYTGLHGVAMELGHLIVEPGGRLCGCGNRGCLEQYASGTAIVLNYAEHETVVLDAKKIAILAERGEAKALKAFEQAATFLAMALAHVLKVIDISDVRIGGGLSQAWPFMQPVFLASFEASLIPALRGQVRVALSNSGDRAGMLGAAMLFGADTHNPEV